MSDLHDERLLAEHRRHALDSILILLCIGGVLLISAVLVAGRPGALIAAGLVALTFLFGPRLSGRFVLMHLGARPLAPSESPWLYQAVHALSQRAGLAHAPRIYALPSPEMNAVTVEDGKGPAIIAITRGLAEALNRRQMTGVLAHELAHLRNGDLRWLTLANLGLKLTTILFRLGLLLMIASVPMALMGRGVRIPLLGGLFLFVAPLIVQLLALALSRTRELDADAVAAALTRDPEGLASALEVLVHRQRPLWARVMRPWRAPPTEDRGAEWLKSHPEPLERARRLRALAPRQRPPRWDPHDWDDRHW